MKKLLLLLIIPFLSFGQGWEQIYSLNEINDVEFLTLQFIDGQQTNDGGCIVLGFGNYTAEYYNGSTANWERPFVIKLDSEGNEEWQKIIFEDYERINMNRASIIQTTDGGYALVGDRFSYDIGEDSNQENIFNEVTHSPLLKLFENGYEEWSQTYSIGQSGIDDATGMYFSEYDQINKIKQSSDNGYIIAGFASSSTTDYNNFFSAEFGTYIIKTDINGIEESRYPISIVNSYSLDDWLEQTISLIIVREVLEVNDGYVILELKQGFEGYYSVLTKINYDGDVMWYYNFVNSPILSSIKNTSDGGFIGSYNSNNSGQSSIIKLNSDGQEVWSQTFENTVICATQTLDQGYIVLTNDESGEFKKLLKTNSYGEIEWEQNYGIQGGQAKAEQTTDGGYIIFGNKTPSSLYIIKTNEFGNITSTIELPTPTSNRKLVTTTNIIGGEASNSKGFQLHIYDDGSVEKKYLIK